LLDMDSGIKFPSVGDWVTVCHGLYKGDVGYISSIENWGQVTFLLIPCPPPPSEVGPSSSKGKRKQSGTCPDPAMVTWEVLDNILLTHGITQYKQEDDRTKMTCVLLGHTFENSLEHRTFNLSAISLTVSMLNDTFFLFQSALHPKTRHVTFPCPSEWKISEGKCVFVRSSENQGIIKAIWANSVEVDLEAGEGLMHILWSALQKCVSLTMPHQKDETNSMEGCQCNAIKRLKSPLIMTEEMSASLSNRMNGTKDRVALQCYHNKELQMKGETTMLDQGIVFDGS